VTAWSRREIRIPAYWLAVGILIAVVSPIMSVLASRTIAVENASRLIRQQQQEQARQVAVIMATTCSLFRSQLDAYDETPPTTETGRNIRDAWLTEYRLYRCQPPR
jgi:heme exporter protein D